MQRKYQGIMEGERQRRVAAEGFAHWAQNERWHLALTLDCASGISRERAELLAQHFWQKADCETYGAGQVKRQKKRLKRICFWHGNTQEMRNWHLHCAVQLAINDENWRQDEELERLALQFGERLVWHWQQLDGAGRFPKIELINSEIGWTHYIRKEEHYNGDSFAARISTLTG